MCINSGGEYKICGLVRWCGHRFCSVPSFRLLFAFSFPCFCPGLRLGARALAWPASVLLMLLCSEPVGAADELTASLFI